MGKTAWQSRRDQNLESLSEITQCIQALDAIGDLEGIGYIYATQWGHRVDIQPLAEGLPEGAKAFTAREVAMQVVARLKANGMVPPMVTKNFDSTTGKITYSMPGPLPGWKIQVSGGEARCKVKPVTRKRVVPATAAVSAVEAHEVEYVAYEIENPEECGAEG